jgi:hypothetical protein
VLGCMHGTGGDADDRRGNRGLPWQYGGLFVN